jgi:RNA polymerase sigma factor (sigma-70 family)
MGFVEFYNASDSFIWDKFREGNPNAFEIIYERHIGVLANYGNRMCEDPEMVKDAIQDMFVDLWKSRNNLNKTDSIKFYLLKAYRRNLIKKIIAVKKVQSYSSEGEIYNGGFTLSHELSIIHAEMEQATINQLNQQLEELPPRQKEALFLRFYGGLNCTEISEFMEISHQSVLNMVYRALETLRKTMGFKAFLLLSVWGYLV